MEMKKITARSRLLAKLDLVVNTWKLKLLLKVFYVYL